MTNQPVSITDVLNDPEGRRLVELIEELIGERDHHLVAVRNRYIKKLYERFGYKYLLGKEGGTE